MVELKRLLALWMLLSFGIIALGGCSLAAEKKSREATATIANPTSIPTLSATETSEPSPTPTESVTPPPTLIPSPSATPFITPPARGESVFVPILMYHHLNILEPNASTTLRTWTVSPTEFARQLEYLQENGYHTITFGQLVDFFDQNAPLPERPIILTFDDGWMEQYTVGFHELQKRGMVGTFFPPTSYVDAGGKSLFDWDQAREMSRAGMEFGGHTVRHVDLNTVTLDQVRQQLRGAKQEMEEKLGQPTVALSYPFGSFNPQVVAETEAAGYRAAVILCCGYKQSADAMLLMPRIRISYHDSLDDIAKRLPLW